MLFASLLNDKRDAEPGNDKEDNEGSHPLVLQHELGQAALLRTADDVSGEDDLVAEAFFCTLRVRRPVHARNLCANLPRSGAG